MIETLVQCKPGRPDYRRPNAWRPIALSDGHGRLANSCLAIILTSKAELLGLIPSLQFGARPGHSTTDSIHLMVDHIKQLWREGNIVSVLFMDVKGAFPSVNLKMMYHELRLLGVPQEIVAWLQCRYANRYTRITFDDYVSDPIRILGGEDQGDPNAGIAYILYAAGLLKKFEGRSMEEGYRFMDNVAAMKWGKDVNQIHEELGEMMEREEGVLDWAKQHNCSFGVDKFKVVDFTRRRDHVPGQKKTELVRGAGVNIGTFQVKSESSVTFLGVLMDQALHWKEQHALMRK